MPARASPPPTAPIAASDGTNQLALGCRRRGGRSGRFAGRDSGGRTRPAHAAARRKESKPGVKILHLGGHRCNLTHATDRGHCRGLRSARANFCTRRWQHHRPPSWSRWSKPRGWRRSGKRPARFFRPAIGRSTCWASSCCGYVAAIARWPWASRGKSSERAPADGFRLRDSGCALCTPRAGVGDDRRAIVSRLRHDRGRLRAGRLTWATRIVPPRPAARAYTISTCPGCESCQGVTIPDVQLRVIEPVDQAAKRGRLQARRRGLAFVPAFRPGPGPVALDVSREISGHPEPRKLVLVCDFLPTTSDGRARGAVHLSRRPRRTEAKSDSCRCRAEVPRRLTAAPRRRAGLAAGAARPPN